MEIINQGIILENPIEEIKENSSENENHNQIVPNNHGDREVVTVGDIEPWQPHEETKENINENRNHNQNVSNNLGDRCFRADTFGGIRTRNEDCNVSSSDGNETRSHSLFIEPLITKVKNIEKNNSNF